MGRSVAYRTWRGGFGSRGGESRDPYLQDQDLLDPQSGIVETLDNASVAERLRAVDNVLGFAGSERCLAALELVGIHSAPRSVACLLTFRHSIANEVTSGVGKRITKPRTLLALTTKRNGDIWVLCP